ncbi:Oidioi.mRNA.OKI2018_I69.XSR.g15959.t1.cds [Oikopleura dioica]|uniref:Oidioi.mRNA.OKI2018_I69.XSR.g15959.t1.cds n=1 Tax=Oikopleura dioica TaxID=34765 RepID=A0ABN7SIG6_OIKDI|nr:Oidioi.mRNA.OKI2018_I69.XSR.g15959.t1.cds [Oikopleura dioica]
MFFLLLALVHEISGNQELVSLFPDDYEDYQDNRAMGRDNLLARTSYTYLQQDLNLSTDHFRKIVFTDFSECIVINEDEAIKYRYHCNEGVFTVEVAACTQLQNKWVIRFDALDRLGGCINVIEHNEHKSIVTQVGKCGTKYRKENGWIFITNQLHIFRSVDDQAQDHNGYNLTCAYEEILEFEYDLSGVNEEGSFNDVTVNFFESSNFLNPLPSLNFEIGEEVFFSFTWNENNNLLNYAISRCALKDKKLKKNFPFLEGGCVNSLVGANRYNDYLLSTSEQQRFSFVAFTFPDSDNQLTLACQINYCLKTEETCGIGPRTCNTGYLIP